MESANKLSEFCKLTKETCPHYRNSTCQYRYHRSDNEVYSYQPKREARQQEPQDLFHKELKAQKTKERKDFGAQNQPQRSARGGQRGGRGNNSGPANQTTREQQPRTQQVQQRAQQQPKPMTEEVKYRNPQPKVQQVEQITPRKPLGPPTHARPNEEPNHFTRKCKLGPNCKDRLLNRCLFIHDEEPIINNQQDLSQQQIHQKPRQDIQNKQIPAQNQHVNKKTQCRNGPNCKDFKNQRCRFQHDAGGQEREEVKKSGSITDQQRDYRMKRDPKKQPVQQAQPEEEEEEEAKQVNQPQAKKLSRNKFFYSDLKSMVEIENDRDFIRALTEIKGGILDKINNTIIERDMPDCMLRFLERMLKQKDSEICRDLVNTFIESTFFSKISEYILQNGMTMASNDPQKKYKFMMTSIWTMNQLMGLYQSYIEKFQVTITAIYADSYLFATQIKDPAKKLEFESAIKLLMQRYQETRTAKEEEKQQQQRPARRVREEAKAAVLDESYKNEPAADFKDVDVVPGYRELEPLTDEQLKVIRRRMPERGDLVNSHNYLDIVFRLLHEDAIADLRNGIDQLRQLQARGAHKGEIRKKLKDNQVKMHDNLTIQSLEVAEGASCIQFRLPQNKKHLVDWRVSKKLMGGSLVILSSDGFQNFVIGLLKHGDSKQRNDMQAKYGYIPINIEILKQSDNQEFNSFNFIMNFKSHVFDMIESSAYFESYRHVLMRLQEMDRWQIFPMQLLLVNCNREAIEQPTYLRQMIRQNSDQINEDIARMHLDNSQQNALIHSLETNFSLIQGPPGTGKTFIGVQIVKLLIKYRAFWCKQGPILLVTYTNHALEQFLHFIKDITTEIVRIGGKPSTDDLAEFGLHERLRNQKIKRSKLFYEAKDGEREAQQQIDHLKVELLKFEYKCISNMIKQEEHEGIYDIMSKLTKNFMQHLNNTLQAMDLEIYTQDLVQNRLKALRKTTQTNIIGLIWLGIIDLERFIDFIIEDENRKERINQLHSQIDKKNNKNKQLARKIDEKLKAIQTNSNKIIEINKNLDKERANLLKKKEIKNQQQKIQPHRVVYVRKEQDQQKEQDNEEEKKEEDKSQQDDINPNREEKKEEDKSQQDDINPKIEELQNRINELTKKNEDSHNEITQLTGQQQQNSEDINQINHQILEIQREAMNFREAQADQRAGAENDLVLHKDDIVDKEQRQLDYEDKRLIINGTVDALIEVLNDIVDPYYMSDVFQGAETMNDCIQYMQANTFYDHEEAAFALQLFLNSKDNPFDRQKVGINQRWRLNNFYLNDISNKTITQLNAAIEKYQRCFRVKKEIEAIASEQFLRSQHVIAMTTTGRAKNSQFLSGIEFPIVIVEEAAEVFEAHILTSLTKNTQHVILIGDHEQLKPNPAVYELDKQYNLSMSLFERLIKNGLNHSTLSIQRRMRPEIARIMNFIYEDLNDFPDVGRYPNVSGLASNVFFFDHKFKEEELAQVTSKMNVEEAKMIVRFTQYILQQKQYSSQNITILTLYAGQLLKIKKLMQDNPLYNQGMRQIKVANVDNYQGEENEIIILSLVRSNAFNNIGFLKTSNRVCVALSRAKHGLYIFGNSSCLVSGKNPLQLWVKVVNYLRENNYIGDEIHLKCEQHGNVASIKKLEDFAKVPEGGCSQKCIKRLDCGHSCEKVCHPIKRTEEDPSGHANEKCIKPCARNLPCGHPCTYLCHQCKNGNMPCVTKIEIIMQPCRHPQVVECHKRDLAVCKTVCGKILKCGHFCKQYCSKKCDDPRFPCKEHVNKKLACGHTVEADCYQQIESIYCYKQCSAILSCGHQCQRKCGECKKFGHSTCQQKCDRNLVCGHQCKEPCIKNCPPCQQKCKTKCPHSECSKICNEVCTLCSEPCDIGCEHSKCTRKCSEPCNNKLCNLPCPKLLSCKHPCISLCGLKCPDLCKLCSPDDPNFDENFQFAEHDVKYVRLDDCGHLFDHEFLDGWMKAQEESDVVKFKECPKCKTPIMSCPRYNNTINKTLNDINAIKALILQKDKQLRDDFRRIKEQLEKFYANLTSYDQKEEYFKNLYALHKDLKRHFEYAEKQRDTELLNKVVVKLNFLNELFVIAKLHKQHTMHLSDKAIVLKVFQVYCSNRIEDIHQQVIDLVSRTLADLQKRYNDISFMEEIIKATNIDRGHWNKCPNGHYYAIGDCGGAMVESRCPDCNALIGGSNHQLAQGNTFASELGGVSAWDPIGFNARVARGEINLNNI